MPFYKHWLQGSLPERHSSPPVSTPPSGQKRTNPGGLFPFRRGTRPPPSCPEHLARRGCLLGCQLLVYFPTRSTPNVSAASPRVPAGLQGRIAFGQNLKAALEEAHVAFLEEIQPFPVPEASLVFHQHRARHVGLPLPTLARSSVTGGTVMWRSPNAGLFSFLRPRRQQPAADRASFRLLRL